MMSKKRPILRQSWQDLLFLHWEIEPELIQRRLPPGLTVETFEGKAYLGIVPFYMNGLRPTWAPAVPGISFFPELNLRTYAKDRSGNRGVWFFSLDAHTRISVAIARTFFNLPYRYAKMCYRTGDQGKVTFRSSRPNEPEQRFVYRPTHRFGPSERGSLNEFLVERYKLFAYSNRGVLRIGSLQHAPYDLHEVEVENYSSALFEINGFATPSTPPVHAVYSKGVQVDVFPMRTIQN
jgi:uncharacterized protein YqjF (DUF2071 family)